MSDTPKTFREAVLDVCVRRGWSLHWTHRSAYLHLEAAELAEAVRGKRGNTLDESADVLITLLALSPHDLREIEDAAWRKLIELRHRPPYAGEERAAVPPPESAPPARFAVPHAFERHHGDERDCTAYGYCHFGACLRREDDPLHRVGSVTRLSLLAGESAPPEETRPAHRPECPANLWPNRCTCPPVVQITSFPFAETHCANPDTCPVCRPSERCGAEAHFRSGSPNGGWIIRSCGRPTGHAGSHVAGDGADAFVFRGDDRPSAPATEGDREPYCSDCQNSVFDGSTCAKHRGAATKGETPR